MSAKLVPTFAGRGCRVVSATDPQGRILGFLDYPHFFKMHYNIVTDLLKALLSKGTINTQRPNRQQ
jgi:hypothetical protein